MEPVFQRLGDVTIQRLEKPKEKVIPPQVDITPLSKDSEEEISSPEGYNVDESSSSKRITDIAGPSNKRFKLDLAHVTLEKKNSDNSNLQNFSDNDLSEYYTESEVESDGEDEIPTRGESPKEEKIAAEEPSFLDKLTEPPVLRNDSTTTSTTTTGDNEDYDYDIKQKLKEMGEISFETVKKSDAKPKKMERVSENEVVVTPAKKPTDEDVHGERKVGMLRRNIREVMDETKLDEATLAAQRQEMERLQRVNEQQRFLREVQRQMAQERMQNKVLSLLQGSSSSKPGTSGTKIGNTVLVKLPNGESKPMTKLPKKPFELVKVNKSATAMGAPKTSCNIISIKKPQGNLTPSVSIAPVAKKIPPAPTRPPSESDSEPEDMAERPPEKPVVKKEPVPTIDISSDDDCIVVSETEADATPDEPDEDPSNSGMHTNDEFNQPDEQGRVVVNIGHPDGEPDIYLAPQLARIIKPHQIGGIRFLFDNVIESIDRFETSTGFGCILAHSMGLGKTLQIVSFSDIFLRHTPAKTILCIMPINTLQNWMAEYNMWLPTEEAAAASPLQVHGEVRPRTFNLHVLNDSHKTLVARAKVIRAWKQDGGVLLIGYEQYRLLSMKKHPKSRRKRILQEEPKDDDKNKALFDEVYEALVKPGPDLVICDEGHRIKNSHASISQALKQMRTKRRIVLTGYPLQNNLMEYWCMVDFVRPNYLGTKTEFCNMFERPIQNGQCIDSTEADIKLMRYRAHVLHSLLVGFVQRRSHTVLQKALPQKEEYVLLVRMTEFQRKLYETFMNEVVRIQTVPNPLKAFAVCCKIWNHPDVLYYFLKKRAGGEAVDIDLEEVAGATTSNSELPVKAKRGPKKKSAKTKECPKQPVVPSSSNSNSSNSNSALQQTSSVASNPFDDSDKSEINYKPPPYPNYNQQVYQQQNYNSQSTYQNYWGGENYNSQTDFYNCRPVYNQNFPGGAAWIKNEEGKPVITNNVVSSPMKNDSDNCSPDCKPKINIISDIKLNNVALPKFTQEKKINILSDIKLEPKKEEIEEKPVNIVKEEPPKAEAQDDDAKVYSEAPASKPAPKDLKEDTGIPYDWAVDLLKDYVPGCIENSAKMEILFCIIRESIALGDRLLVFSQSLITLDLIEQFLQMNVVPGETQRWAKNTSYYRLDGSTSALEREKLINEFNCNPKIHLFLVSTRAGSLGINLVGANRVVVLDASWNPCHDTQAVCRVYRYGQRKPCFVYRLVVDNCLEKKIYDRQINKQGMSDRVVDECNPDAHLTMKDVSTLCWDDNKEDGEEKDWSYTKENYVDVVLQKVLETLGRRLNKEPFQHESLLVDRKDKQLSQQEKRLAKKSYERDKQASRQPAYNLTTMSRGRPVASVRPMQQGGERPSRWIPAEHWQRQGMTAQEMTLPLDVVIPTNQPEKGNIVLKAGQKVLVLKSPKGVYMQLESGKIVAIKTAIKVRGKAEDNDPHKMLKSSLPPSIKNNSAVSILPPKRMVKPFTPGLTKMNVRSIRQPVPNLVSRIQSVSKKMQMAKAKPYQVGSEIAKAMNNRMNHNSLPMSSSDEEGLSGEGSLMNLFSDEERQPMDDATENGLLGRGSLGNVRKQQLSRQQQQHSQMNRSRMLAHNSGGRGYRDEFAAKRLQNKHVSPLEQLEQSASSLMDHAQQGFQDTLDTLAETYPDDDKFEDQSAEENADSLQDSLSDEVQEIPQDTTATLSTPNAPLNHTAKTENIPPADYGYNTYYNYNPYPPPHPIQGYATGYPPQQTHYDMSGYTAAPPPQQPPPPPPPQYNYPIYPPPPQGYTPYTQPGYDYNHPPHPPPPVYGGYNPYPQQYPAQAYPPPAPGYPPDYQYPPPQQAPPPAGASYYPTS